MIQQMHTDACMSVDIVTSVTLRNLHHHCDLVYDMGGMGLSLGAV